MTGKELQEELTWKFPHIAKEAPEQVEEAAAFCEGYKAFLDEGKTERMCQKGSRVVKSSRLRRV